jgi:hypothetical protein
MEKASDATPTRSSTTIAEAVVFILIGDRYGAFLQQAKPMARHFILWPL